MHVVYITVTCHSTHAQGTRMKQSTEGEEEIDGERPLNLVTAHQVALRTGEVHN